MRGLRIDGGGIAEVHGDLEELLDERIEWDAFDLGGGHDVWVHDQGLFEPGVLLATIGDRAHVPLPALVLGLDGERTVGATIGIDDLARLVRLEGPAATALGGALPRDRD